MYKLRDLEQKLIDSAQKPEVTILLGPRQAGKTFLLKHLKEILPVNSLFIDLDLYENRRIFSSYTEALKYLIFQGLENDKKFILFLDEFHTVSGIDKIFKNFYDHHPNLKIFATGSSSLEAVKHIRESMAGRKSIYYLYPLSFQEFLRFKDESLAAGFERGDKYEIPAPVRDRLNDYVREFCVFGGYPKVVLAKTKEEKTGALRDIFDLFIKKDLIEFLRVKNPSAALDILKYLAINTGGIINYHGLCVNNHVDINTLKKYLYLLNETFIVRNVPPFFKNKNKEIVKAPKIYFIDPGARNYFLKDFSEFDSRSDNGFLLENFALAQFVKRGDFLTGLKYWRDKNGREVDFILEQEGKIEAYEIKYKNDIPQRDLANLRYFTETHKPSKSFLVNRTGESGTRKNVIGLHYFQI